MTRVARLGALALVATGAASAPVAAQSFQVERQVMIRVTRTYTVPNPPADHQILPQGKGKTRKCVPAAGILRAIPADSQHVALTMRTGSTVVVKLTDACPTIAYYRSFYVRPDEDGLVCADRDPLIDRTGNECAIDKLTEHKAKN